MGLPSNNAKSRILSKLINNMSKELNKSLASKKSLGPAME